MSDAPRIPYKPKFRKKSRLTAANDVLLSLLQIGKLPISDQYLRWQIWFKWPEVIGGELSAQCEPVDFFKGELSLWVEHPVFIQQLKFITQDMMDKINAYVGKPWVTSIKFTLNRKKVPIRAEAPEDLKKFLSSELPSEDVEPQPDPFRQKDR